VILDQLQSAIADRYKVERELGKGGMATVFLATDVRHERQVAIKVLHPDLAATIGAERFEREIKLAAKLQHPHILGLYDSGAANGLLYYVMPFIQGESVRDKLDREKQLSVDDAIQITLEVADALGYAHAQDIVHRDIKPENVMMSNGHALVADFGIARARTEAGQNKLTQTGMAVGTPVYMSPEQATGETVGPSADIYSLGCMLYEMLAGEPPFQGPNAMAIMARHAMEAVPSIRIIRPSVPEEVEEAIFHAMEKNVADRPKSAAEFCEIMGTPLGATATRRVTGRHTARHRIPTGARYPAYTPTDEIAIPKPTPLYKRPLVVGSIVAGLVAAGWATVMALNGRSANAAADTDVRKIAILYFDDRSGGKLEYLADGLTESLIEQLKRVNELQVFSKEAVERFRGSGAVDSVTRALEPGTIVRGNVDEEGSDRVRVNIQVIDGVSKAERGDGLALTLPTGDPIALQQQLSDSVASYLRQFVGTEIRARNLESGTRNPAAWTTVQRAERLRKDALSAAGSGDSVGANRTFGSADSLLSEAEKLDPKWVTPIALRASLALYARVSRTPVDAEPIVTKGLEHAERALAVDPRNLDALEARGRLRKLRWDLNVDDKATGDRLLEGARDDLTAVTTQDATRALAWVALSAVHTQLKDQTASYLAAERALEADAYFTGVDAILFQLYTTAYNLEQFAQSKRRCDEGARRFPRNWRFASCKLFLLASREIKTPPESAWRDLRTLEELVPANEKAFQVRRHTMFVAGALAQNGLRDSARHVMEKARAGKDIDPNGGLLTMEALNRQFLGTAADTIEAYKLLQQYVIGQPLHGRGFADTKHWWWRGLKADAARWNQYLGAVSRP
jgi:TolB-like protein/tRNA A-37 threonylcarbamoyl transferase component Bud32